MAKIGCSAATSSGTVDAGFAKLQGKDFEYYMQTYSIILGRNSKNSIVDVDLVSLGGGTNISRQHAIIFYDFEGQHFALDVIGKNGCLVKGVLHLRGSPPVKLHSRDLLQMGDLMFYFLLPTRSIFATAAARGNHPSPLVDPFAAQTGLMQPLGNEEKKGNEEVFADDRLSATEEVPKGSLEGEVNGNCSVSTGLMGKKGLFGPSDTRDRETERLLLLRLEEEDVIKSVDTVLSDLYSPGERIPMVMLHTKLFELYGGLWDRSKLQRYLMFNYQPQGDAPGSLWSGLITALRKHPEKFVITTKSTDKGTCEFVSLVSLLP